MAPLTSFTGRDAMCRDCRRVANAYYNPKNNPKRNETGVRRGNGKYVAAQREASARRRAKKQGLDEHFTNRQWQLLLKWVGNKCQRCGSTDNLSHDHVWPLEDKVHIGPLHHLRDTIINLQVLCCSCNSWKGCYRVVDYRKPEDKAYAWHLYHADKKVETG